MNVFILPVGKINHRYLYKNIIISTLIIGTMSFQAYLDNIQAKTGKTAEDFVKLATKKGFIEKGILKPSVKATEIVQWLKDEYELGHGHAMSIFAYFKGKRE